MGDKTKIGIIGMGFVGKITSKAFSKACEVFPYDKYKIRYSKKEDLKKADMIFICVPTPLDEKNGNVMDLSAIYESMDLISSLFSKKGPLVVIRSTFVPGTTDFLEKKYPNLQFVVNPEFLREKSSVQDFLGSSRIVIGAKNKRQSKPLESLYRKIIPNAEYIKTDPKTAESIKCASNLFLAGQIALANEIYQVCQVLNVNYDFLKKTLLLDKRIARNIDVPGPDGNLGFGGKCFPKDVRAMISCSEKKGYDPVLLKKIWKFNQEIRGKKDWRDIPGAVSENKKFRNS